MSKSTSIFLILLLGSVLRLSVIDWGLPTPYPFQPWPFHPDEEAGFITTLRAAEAPFAFQTSQYVHTKGAGFFYTGAAVLHLSKWLGINDITVKEYYSTPERRKIYLTLRLMVCAFSIGSIFLVFLIGERLFNRDVGLVAALLLALSPISIIDSHYVKTDTASGFMILLCLWLTVKIPQGQRFLWLSFFAAGAAGAFKYTAFSAIVFPFAYLWLFGDRSSILKKIPAGIACITIGFICFFPSILIEPDLLLPGFKTELFRKITQAEDASQPLLMILQYPYRLAMGTGIVAVVIAGLAILLHIIKPGKQAMLLLAWLIPYMLVISSSLVPLLRYSVAATPIAALLIASILTHPYIQSLGTKAQHATRILIAITALHLLLVSYTHIKTMLDKDPRLQAAKWISQNIAPGTVVALTPSHVDDTHFIVSANPEQYPIVFLPFKKDDNVDEYHSLEISVLATNEAAWNSQYAHHQQFWRQLEQQWQRRVTFNNRPSLIGLPMSGELPEDLYYLYQETRVYTR